MDGMIKKTLWIGLTLSLLGFVSASNARADDFNKKSILTFSQPFEIPGKVLPAGTYVFEIADTVGDRHIVRIFNKDRSEVIATVMTIPDHRLTSTSETVIKFGEVPAGSPEVMRAWFYPGNTIGEEFVYSKRRAAQLAKASRIIVPATTVDVASADDFKTARIVAVTPEQKEVDVTTAIQTTPAPTAAARTTRVEETGRSARLNDRKELPKTASALSLIVLLGLGSIGAAFGLMAFGKKTTASV
jgi:hypothetical protein